MPDSFDFSSVPRDASFLWVDLTRKAGTALRQTFDGSFAVRRVTEAKQIPSAIQLHTPPFLCFEFDAPRAPEIAALAHTRREHPCLPVLMITGCHSEALALWALRIRVWDLLVKPFPVGLLSQRIGALTELTRGTGPRPAHEILFAPQGADLFSSLHQLDRQARTHFAITHVAAHFDRKIALNHVAILCQLSPPQFCRVFKQEHGLSFVQYLLRYRIERACERLANPGARAKDVAYSVGFNDLTYFSRAFKRQVGVCPSEYQGAQGWDCPGATDRY
jgi:AraC-like DNA-binding protein